MDPNERFEDRLQPFRQLADRGASQLWTAMPAFITKGGWDPERQVVQLTIGVKAQANGVDENGQPGTKAVSMPQLKTVPVHFPAGGGFTLTWPLADGDEGLVVFASRCIDFWWQNGGEQPRGSERQHDLSDGIFIPGLKSQPNRLKNPAPSTGTVQLRSNDGTAYLEFSKSGAKIVFPGGSFEFKPNGDFTATGEVTRGQGTSRKVTLGEHSHPQGVDSRGDAEQDTQRPKAE